MTLNVLSHGLHGGTSNISNIRVELKIYVTVFLSLVLSSQTWTCVIPNPNPNPVRDFKSDGS